MPVREIVFSPNHYYHVFNKSLATEKPFSNDRVCRRATLTLRYYQSLHPSQRLSYYLTKSLEERQKILFNIDKQPKRVEVLSYCFMPNHFHILIKELSEGGIVSYLASVQNSISKYINTKNKRKGPLFVGRFRAVLIESNEQLIHVSRYIHLNPLTTYRLNVSAQLDGYAWSSWQDYMNIPVMFPFVNKFDVLSQFLDIQDYRHFCFSQIDYQRQLNLVKKMLLDDSDSLH